MSDRMISLFRNSPLPLTKQLPWQPRGRCKRRIILTRYLRTSSSAVGSFRFSFHIFTSVDIIFIFIKISILLYTFLCSFGGTLCSLCRVNLKQSAKEIDLGTKFMFVAFLRLRTGIFFQILGRVSKGCNQRRECMSPDRMPYCASPNNYPRNKNYRIEFRRGWRSCLQLKKW